MKMKFNPSYIAIGLILVGYLFSAGRFMTVSAKLNSETEDDIDGAKIIRVAHWQLEPGFREGLQSAIDAYNALPYNIENNIRVEQMGITERVYGQFLNVHMISGTAPDIAAAGMSRILRGSNMAKFFMPLGDFIDGPNPYNSKEYTSPDLPEELRDYLATAPWKETLIDGMQGGYDFSLENYFSIPVSVWGGQRIFYNMAIVAEAKAYLRAAIESSPQPAWLAECWFDGEESGYVTNNDTFKAWLTNDDIPDSLGQLMTLNRALSELIASDPEDDRFPISTGAQGGGSEISIYYEPLFFFGIADKWVIEQGTPAATINGLETLRNGLWDFDTPAVREYFNFAQDISSYYPIGYIGLDREQAQRRFVLGGAMLYATGGWDASGIFYGVANRDNPQDRFEIKLSKFPIPVEEERWHKYVPISRSEAEVRGGVPLAINQATPYPEICLDFLKFLSSQPINESFNYNAGWLPVAVGAEPVERMKPFVASREGIPLSQSLTLEPSQLSVTSASFRIPFMGYKSLLRAGQITQEEFSERVEELLSHPIQGMDSVWVRDIQRRKDQARGLDRKVSSNAHRSLQTKSDRDQHAYANSFYFSISRDEGFTAKRDWHALNGDKPFPTIGEAK